MAIIKRANTTNNSFQSLNKPEWIEYNLSEIKVASIQKDKDVNGFDIEAAIKKNPEHLFVKVFAIKENEVNDNGDYFSKEELIKAAPTFIGVPVFCNHQNDDIEKARGKVVHAWYDEDAQGIYIISSVDRTAYPKLARSIEQGYVNSSSMGAAVGYSLCSVCHNSASAATDFCSHIKERKNKNFNGEHKCCYHESSEKPQGDCPICGKKKNEEKLFKYQAQKVFEHNYNVKFIEDSFVVNPACHSCLVQEVFNIDQLEKKVANLKNQIVKMYSHTECTTGCLTKTAGMKEIEYLNEAMNKIEVVARSMMSQKQHVSMEYVSDLVDTLASVQDTLDELVEMGYGQLPSPTIKESAIPMETPVPKPIQQAPTQINTSTPNTVSEPLNGIGNITKPKAAKSEEEIIFAQKKDFKEIFGTLKDKLQIMSNKIDTLINNNEILTKESNVMSNKNSQNNTNTEKTASQDTDVITEKQLDSNKGMGERYDAPTVITEKQLDAPKDVNVTTSETPQKRLGSPDVITEKQFDAIKSGYVVRWNDFPEVITDKQLADVVKASSPTVITEKQLEDGIRTKSFPEVITEKQLDAAKTQQTKRWANANEIVKVAMNALSDTIAFYKKTPQDIVNAVNTISKNLDKAAFVTLVNALPIKNESRQSEKNKYSYFSKMASANIQTPNAVDSLIVSTADHVEHFSTTDIFKAMKVITASQNGISKLENLAKEKLEKKAEIVQEQDNQLDFEAALNNFGKPEDGLYQVMASVKDINVNPENKKDFINAVNKFAQKEISSQVGMVKTALLKVDIDEDNEAVVATLKDETLLTNDEKVAVAQAKGWLDNTDPQILPSDEFADEGPENDFLEGLEPTDEELQQIELENAEDPSFEQNPNFEGTTPGYDFGTDIEVTPKTDKTKNMFASSKKNVKTAQMFGGGAPAGSGGEGLGAGAPAAGQGAPGIGGGMGAAPAPADQPLESFEKTDMGAKLDEESGDMAAKPPGSICPVCGSNDVDIIKGSGKCNNCTSEMAFEINIKVTKWSGLTEDKSEKKEEEKVEGEGFKMPGEEAPPVEGAGMPMAASKNMVKTAQAGEIKGFGILTKLSTAALKKAAEAKVQLGSISPITGSANTIKLANGSHLCLDSGIAYDVMYAVNSKNHKEVYAGWRWNPNTKVACDNCSRQKMNFVKALKDFGMTEGQFDALDFKEKGNTILAMNTKGLIKNVKVANNTSTVSGLKTVMASVDKSVFPIESCRQKLANRFGENAVALSGPCEGKPLYDCVCNSLKTAGVYSNDLAIKVASVWVEKDASENCIEDCVKEHGFTLKQASTICSALKNKYAQIIDMVAEEIGNDDDNTPPTGPGGGSDGGLPVETPEENLNDVSPFDGEEATETVTLELPKSVIEQIDKAMDVALGENVNEEEHHQEEGGVVEITPENGEPVVEDVSVDEVPENGVKEEVEIEIEIPADANEAVEEAAQQVDDETKAITDSQKSNLPAGLANAIEKKENGSTEEKPEEKNDENKNFAQEKATPETLEEKVEALEKKIKKLEGDEKDEVPGVSSNENEELEKEGTEETKEETVEKEANANKSSKIIHAGKSTMDLSNVIKVLNKQAKAITQQNAQDAKDIGKIQDGKTMGNEDKFDAKKPDVPSKGDAAKLGKETPVKPANIDVPSGKENMGDEQFTGGDTSATGGDNGAGTSKAASAKDRIATLADSIKRHMKIAADKKEEVKVETRNKATQKKIAPKEPVSTDKDIQPIQNGKTLGSEDKFDAKEVKDGDVKTDGGFIGKEKETFKSKPDSPKDHQEVPAGKGKFENETNEPEKQEKVKGTVIAESNDSKKIYAEAARIAGRMLTMGKIQPENLADKIESLKKYKLAELSDFEKDLFAQNKGLNTVADGLEQTIVISESQNSFTTKTAGQELKEKLSNLFGSKGHLSRQNEQAQNVSAEMNKAFNR